MATGRTSSRGLQYSPILWNLCVMAVRIWTPPVALILLMPAQNHSAASTQLPCPCRGPVVDFIFACDSSMAFVDEGTYADGTTKRVKRNVGEYLDKAGTSILTDRAGSVQYTLR